MLPSDVLEKGWIQGKARSDFGTKFCIMGALDYCGTNSVLYQAVYKEVMVMGGVSAPTWNDERDRTQAEVVALVRRAEIACGLRPEDNPEQWEIPAAPPIEAEPVLVESK